MDALAGDAAILIATMFLAPLVTTGLVWVPAARGRWAGPATLLASATSLAAALALAPAVQAGRARVTLLGVGCHLDALGLYVLVLINLVVVVAAPFLGEWSRRTGRSPRERLLLFSLFNLFHATMLIVPTVTNLVVMWVGMELTTVASTALVAADRTRKGLEAAWKYIVITSTGLVFALLGTLFLATSVGAGEASLDWTVLAARPPGSFDPHLVVLAFAVALVGYGTKAGLAPLHTWLPDAHGQAPYPISALLSAVLLKAALYAVLRFKTITDVALGDGGRFTRWLLVAAGLGSVVVSVPFILRRNPFKRVLAYHSLEHMGIITLGLGIGGPLATLGAVLHIANHGVTKALMFLAHGTVRDAYPPHVEGGDRTPEGVLQAMPWTGRFLALGGLALVGAPPFSIFLSELLIVQGTLARARTGGIGTRSAAVAVLVLLLASLVLVFAGLVRHLGRLLLGTPPDGVRPERRRGLVPLGLLLVMVAGAGLTVSDVPGVPLRMLVTEATAVVCGGPCR